MRNKQLDRAFGPTPDLFTRRIDQTLQSLKEEKSMKRFSIRVALIAALLLALLGGIAYALISQGLEWYYNNRFLAYQEYQPEKHEAILHHLQAVAHQQLPEDALVDVEVREASWAAEQKVLVISLAAVPKDAQRFELHPQWNLDVDGGYVGADALDSYADDPDARAEHWLWTEKGFGPIDEVMQDPTRQLILFDAPTACLRMAGRELSMALSCCSMDGYVSESGEVMTVLEIALDWLDPAYDEGLLEKMQEEPQHAGLFQERLHEAQELRSLVQSSGGRVAISVPYTVTIYSPDDLQMHNSARQNTISFEMEIR